MKRTYVLLFFITILGIILRWYNISALKIYPDAYQNLLVANNIQEYGSVAGTLGPQGMFYPPFVTWTRPGYPLLIIGLNNHFPDEADAAQVAALLSSIAAIPLAYMFTGLIGALLMAISWNHTIWGGFIGTETTGVFMVLLFLTLAFRRFHRSSQPAEVIDIFTGLSAAAAILTRFEYILYIVPFLFLLLLHRQWIKVFNILGTMIFGFIIAFATIMPPEALLAVLDQARRQIILAITVCAIALVLLFLKSFVTEKRKKMGQVIVIRIAHIFLTIASVLIALSIITDLPLIARDLAAPRDFFATDALLGITVVIGLCSMLRTSSLTPFTIYTFLTLPLLAFVYYQINPEMQRYWTHLLPVLIVPASIGLSFIPAKAGIHSNHLNGYGSPIKSGMTLLLVALVMVQTYSTAVGIRNWKDGEYLRVSYEEASARILKDRIREDTLLITSMPEPYYFFTGRDTQSIADIPPYIFIENVPDSQHVTIVHDIGMRDIFPRFSKFLDTTMQKYKKGEYKTNTVYHYQERTLSETHPVILYEISLGDLKRIVMGDE